MSCPWFVRALSVLVLSALSTGAVAQYPSKPVRIIHPFAAGGGSDVITRVVVQKLSENTGKSFVVENRTGAGGRIGYETAARAVGDGYTLVTAETTYDMLAGLYGSQLAWDHSNDLIPVGAIAQAPLVIVVDPKLKVTSLRDFIAMAKAAPGKLNYASSGIGSINHIVAEVFKRTAQVDLAHVPYRGMGEAMGALFSGTVSMLILSPITVVPNAKSGKMQPIAIAATRRLAALPEVPSAVEAGLPNFLAAKWFGFLAPKGTPKEIVDWLNGELRKAISDPSVRERFASIGVEPYELSPGHLGSMMREETQWWTNAIRAANIKAE